MQQGAAEMLAGGGVSGGGAVSHDAMAGAREQARRLLIEEAKRVRARPEEEQGTKEEWAQRIQAAFGEQPAVSVKWRHGSFDMEGAAKGARVCELLSAERVRGDASRRRAP